MKEKKPTLDEIQHLGMLKLYGLQGATIEEVSARNHLIYRVKKGSRDYALRMINPESYRAGEWISMYEEFEILRAIEHTGLGPKVFALFEECFASPFLMQEFVEATCFNDLKPLSSKHLVGAAQAIATLNAQDITPKRFPFLKKYVQKSYRGRGFVWRFRLMEAILRTRRNDVSTWALKILPLLRRTTRLLAENASRLPKDFTFHFDGAHCGNTYWRDGRVMFLDWQKVSLRNDPTFTLVRFATSTGEKGVVPDDTFDMLLNAYLDVRSDLAHTCFVWLAHLRLLERQVSDLVWVLWDYARRGDRRPVEEATSVLPRYGEVRRILQYLHRL